MKELSLYQLHLIECIQRLKSRQNEAYDYKSDFSRLSGLSETELSNELDKTRPAYKRVSETSVI